MSKDDSGLYRITVHGTLWDLLVVPLRLDSDRVGVWSGTGPMYGVPGTHVCAHPPGSLVPSPVP